MHLSPTDDSRRTIVQSLEEAIKKLYRHHSIDLGNGIVTPGLKSAESLPHRNTSMVPSVFPLAAVDFATSLFNFSAAMLRKDPKLRCLTDAG